MACVLFGFTALVSGEFNYQGGDRKYLVTHFPFESPAATWHAVGGGGLVTTDSTTPTEVLTSSELPARFAHNVEYFLVGRNFGFVPYFFPGVIAVAWWLMSSARRDRWRSDRFRHSGRGGDRNAHRAAVDVERRRRSARQSLFLRGVSAVPVPDAAWRQRGAWRPRLDRRRALYREASRQPVLGGALSLSGDGEGTAAAAARRVDDGERSAGADCAAAPRARAVPVRSRRPSIFPGSERMAARADGDGSRRQTGSQHLDFRLGPRGHHRAHTVAARSSRDGRWSRRSRPS